MSERCVVLKGFSGLGNRIGALLMAIAYARLSGRRLIVDWNDYRYAVGGQDMFKHLFAAPTVGSVDEIADGASIAPAIWRGALHDPIETMVRRHGISWGAEVPRRLSLDPRRLDYPEEVVVLFDYVFRHEPIAVHADRFPAEWRGLDADGLERRLLRDHVAPIAAVAEEVAAFRRASFGGFTVGAHVRQTDNMERRHLRSKGVAVPAIERALRACLQSTPEATVFVATDNQAVLEAFRGRYPRVVARDKWFPDKAGQALHGNRTCPDKLQMALDALVEIQLLSECDRLIYSSKTSFGRLARLTSRRPGRQTLDVEEPPWRT